MKAWHPDPQFLRAVGTPLELSPAALAAAKAIGGSFEVRLSAEVNDELGELGDERGVERPLSGPCFPSNPQFEWCGPDKRSASSSDVASGHGRGTILATGYRWCRRTAVSRRFWTCSRTRKRLLATSATEIAVSVISRRSATSVTLSKQAARVVFTPTAQVGGNGSCVGQTSGLPVRGASGSTAEAASQCGPEARVTGRLEVCPTRNL